MELRHTEHTTRARPRTLHILFTKAKHPKKRPWDVFEHGDGCHLLFGLKILDSHAEMFYRY